MPIECAVAGCSQLQKRPSTFSFHMFPKKDPWRQAWLVNMNRLDPRTGQLWGPKSHDRICSKHFQRDCFDSRTRLSAELGLKYKATLKADAVPTIFERQKRDHSTDCECDFCKASRKRIKREVSRSTPRPIL